MAGKLARQILRQTRAYFDFLLCFPVMALPDPVKRQAGTTEVCPFASIQRPLALPFQLFFAKNFTFIDKMEDFGVSGLKLRVQILNFCIQILNLWNQIFNL